MTFRWVACVVAGSALSVGAWAQAGSFADGLRLAAAEAPRGDRNMAPLQAEDASPYQNVVRGYVQGLIADIREDESMAVKAYASVLNQDPANSSLHARLFEKSLLDGDVPLAIELAAPLVDVTDNPTMPLLTRAVGFVQQGDLKQAQVMVELAAKVAPDLLQFELLDGYLAVAQGQPADAVIAKWDKLKVPAGLVARRDFHVARLWLKQGNTAKALERLEASNKIETGSLFTTLALGAVYEQNGQPDKARALYELFRSKNPQVALMDDTEQRMRAGKLAPLPATDLKSDVATTLFDFGLLVWAQGAEDPARQLMNLALWLKRDDPYLYYYAGIVNEFGGHLDVAQRFYRMAAQDDAVRLAATVRDADIEFRDGKQDEGRRRIEDMLHDKPDALVLHRTLADMAFEQKDFSVAAKHYKRVLDMLPAEAAKPVRASLNFAYGSALERMGKYDEASRALLASLKLEPANPAVLNYLGYMWVERGMNVPEAMRLLQQALMLNPQDGAIVDSVGWAYFMTKNYDKAVIYLERAIELEPGDVTINDHLGDVYMVLGRKDEAIRQWQRALKLAGSDDAMRRSLQKKIGMRD